jgi:hypothetical protein
MMMKKLFVLILVVLMSVPLFSQINWGIKAGVSTYSNSMSKLVLGNYTIDAVTSQKYGFHGGLFLRIKLLALYVQPEFLLSTRTNEYQISGAAETVKQNLTKLDVPLLVGLKLGPIRLNAGPSANLLLNSPKDIISTSTYDNVQSRMTLGYQAGVGFDLFKKLTIDIRYEGSLKKYQNQIKDLTNNTTINLDDRPGALMFSVGIIL